MESDSRNGGTVLVVDDEPELLALYETWLSEFYDVRTADDGDGALEVIDETVDVALLDRRMPDRSGDDVLAEIRCRGFECRVAMITAVEPDGDIVDMAFDDYVVKPADSADLRCVVDILLRRADYDEKGREFFSLASKKAALEVSGTVDHTSSEEYAELTARMEELRADLDETLEALHEHDYSAPFQEFPSDGSADG